MLTANTSLSVDSTQQLNMFPVIASFFLLSTIHEELRKVKQRMSYAVACILGNGRDSPSCFASISFSEELCLFRSNTKIL